MEEGGPLNRGAEGGTQGGDSVLKFGVLQLSLEVQLKLQTEKMMQLTYFNIYVS